MLTESRLLWREAGPALKAFLTHPDARLIHVVRLLTMANLIDDQQRRYVMGLQWFAIAHLEIFRASHSPKFTLCDLAEAIRTVGFLDGLIIDTALQSYHLVFD